jgi:hypothetical protein
VGGVEAALPVFAVLPLLVFAAAVELTEAMAMLFSCLSDVYGSSGVDC